MLFLSVFTCVENPVVVPLVLKEKELSPIFHIDPELKKEELLLYFTMQGPEPLPTIIQVHSFVPMFKILPPLRYELVPLNITADSFVVGCADAVVCCIT
jgi:hypothetical protein